MTIWRPTENLTVTQTESVLTGAGGAALLGVDFGVLAVDHTLYIRLSDDTFLSQPAGKSFSQFVHFIGFSFDSCSYDFDAFNLSFLHDLCPTIPVFLPYMFLLT